MQSGRAMTGHWVLEYELEAPRTPDPLMGWTSADDTDNQMQIQFPTREDAEIFAHQNGFVADVEDEHDRKVMPKNFAQNYVYQAPKKATQK